MQAFARSTAASIVVKSGATNVESGYIQNVVAGDKSTLIPNDAAGVMTWALTNDFVNTVEWETTIDEKVAWNTDPKESKKELLKDYKFGFTFTNIEEYIKNPDQKYMSVEELYDLVQLKFEPLHMVEYYSDLGQYAVKYTPTAAVDTIKVTCEGTNKWKELGTGYTTAEFATNLTHFAADKNCNAQIKTYYALKCGSMLFPSGAPSEENYLTASYTVSYAPGENFTVDDMQQDWTYNFITKAGTTSQINDPNYGIQLNPETSFSLKAKDGEGKAFTGTLSEYFSTDQDDNIVTTYKKSASGWGDPMAEAMATVRVTPASSGQHVDDDFVIELVAGKWEWGNQYKIVATHVGKENKQYTLTAYFTAGPQPGTCKSSGGSTDDNLHTLWKGGEYVITYEPETEQVSYSSNGVYTKNESETWSNLWPSMKSFFKDYEQFSNVMSAAFDKADAIKSTQPTYVEVGLDSLKLKETEYVYENITDVGESNTIHYDSTVPTQQRYNYDGNKTFGHFGFIDPGIIKTYNTKYRQITSVYTWFNVRFVIVRKMNFSMDNFTLIPNPNLISNHRATYQGKTGTSSDKWSYPSVDLSSYYSVSNAKDAKKVVFTYENVIYSNDKNANSYTEGKGNPAYKYEDGKGSLTLIYPRVYQNRAYFVAESSPKQVQYPGWSIDGYQSKFNTIKDVYIKVTADITLPGVNESTDGAKFTISDYFLLDVEEPVPADKFVVKVTPEVTVSPAHTVSPVNPAHPTWANAGAAYSFFEITTCQKETVLNTTELKNTDGVAYDYQINSKLSEYFDYTSAKNQSNNGGRLYFDFDNATVDGAKFVAATDPYISKIELAENSNTGRSEIAITFKSDVKLLNTIDVVIPVTFNHQVFDNTFSWSTTGTYNFKPFTETKNLTIKVNPIK